MKVNVTVKRRIVVNGKEYGSVDELPDDARAAYERALARGAAAGAGDASPQTTGEIVVNGQRYASLEAMPPEVRRLVGDAMAGVASGVLGPSAGSPRGHGAAAPATTASGPARPIGPGTDVTRYAVTDAPIEPGSTGVSPRAVVTLLLGLVLLGLLAYLFLR